MLFKKKAHSADKIDALRLVDDTTPFAVNEAFRSLYTKVLYLPITDKCRKIAISSAISGEGKTYISINLAITLAKNSDNKKILLIDLDMRKPRVLKILSKYYKSSQTRSGLSEYLAGIDNSPNIVNTDIPNFSILFSGKETSNAIGLLNSKRMDVLLDELSEKYDYIIFDTPPVSVVSDSLVLADKIHGYILATRAEYSNINNLSDAIEAIQNVNGQVFGTVITAVNPKSTGESKNYYRNSNYYTSDKENN